MRDFARKGLIHMEEISSGSESVGLNEGHNEIEIEKAKSVEDPKVGMLFDSIDDLVQFYQRYEKEKVESQRSNQANSINCIHNQKQIANLLRDGKWMLRSMVLDHNHGASLGKARFYKCHRVLNSAVKRRLELHAKAGIRMNRIFNSLVVQAGGLEKLTYLEKDCRNHMDMVRRIKLREGDATTMHNYFLKMQADNSEFFHMMDLDKEGMSTTQRSESTHAFFDGYVNSKTTLKQFVKQYENTLAKKLENENNEEFNSFNSCIPCMVGYEMEKQFQSAYTTAKFKEFQRELIRKISCDLSAYNKDAYISEYKVAKDILFGESRRHISFNVCFDEDINEVYCNCRLFEYMGILCRHQIVVFIHRKVDRTPDKYILKKWSKNVKRSHTKVRISYDNWALKPEARRFDKMCNVFYEVANLAAVSEDWSEKFMERTYGIGISKESTNILDPLIAHSKGRPPFKRRQSMVEKELQDDATIHGARVVELVTEENINLNSAKSTTKRKFVISSKYVQTRVWHVSIRALSSSISILEGRLIDGKSYASQQFH
ncbi:hypothetical protein ACSBR2_008082 [Camellia fascicularis]